MQQSVNLPIPHTTDETGSARRGGDDSVRRISTPASKRILWLPSLRTSTTSLKSAPTGSTIYNSDVISPSACCWPVGGREGGRGEGGGLASFLYGHRWGFFLTIHFYRARGRETALFSTPPPLQGEPFTFWSPFLSLLYNLSHTCLHGYMLCASLFFVILFYS